MAKGTRLIVVADVRFYREQLVAQLAGHADMEIIGTAASLDEVSQLLPLNPAVVVLDVATHASLDIVEMLVRHAPAPRVVGFGVHEVEPELVSCAQAGLSGFVPCDAPIDELFAAVRAVVADDVRCSPRAAALLLRHLGPNAPYAGLEIGSVPLSVRERQVLNLIERDLSNKEIAQALGIEVSTVKNHVHNVLDKLQVGRRSEAATRLRSAARMVKAELRPGARDVRANLF